MGSGPSDVIAVVDMGVVMVTVVLGVVKRRRLESNVGGGEGGV